MVKTETDLSFMIAGNWGGFKVGRASTITKFNRNGSAEDLLYDEFARKDAE
jgi:hypothetical protein